MIEVEKKFKVTDQELAHLLDGAEFVSRKEYTDVYYDKKDRALTIKSYWLRSRAGRFELKVPIGDLKDKRYFTRYHEIEDEKEIARELGIETGGKPLIKALGQLGYEAFATITTTRMKHKKSGLTIDVDRTDFGYDIVEIEAMVPTETETDEAYARIIAFAKAHGLEITLGQTRGKVLEYLYRKDPAHFQRLHEAWGIPL